MLCSSWELKVITFLFYVFKTKLLTIQKTKHLKLFLHLRYIKITFQKKKKKFTNKVFKPTKDSLK
jgi:hypothetical protein